MLFWCSWSESTSLCRVLVFPEKLKTQFWSTKITCQITMKDKRYKWWGIYSWQIPHSYRQAGEEHLFHFLHPTIYILCHNIPSYIVRLVIRDANMKKVVAGNIYLQTEVELNSICRYPENLVSISEWGFLKILRYYFVVDLIY